MKELSLSNSREEDRWRSWHHKLSITKTKY